MERLHLLNFLQRQCLLLFTLTKIPHAFNYAKTKNVLYLSFKIKIGEILSPAVYLVYSMHRLRYQFRRIIRFFFQI